MERLFFVNQMGNKITRLHTKPLVSHDSIGTFMDQGKVGSRLGQLEMSFNRSCG